MAINNIVAIASLEDWDEKIDKSEEMLLGACLRAMRPANTALTRAASRSQ